MRSREELQRIGHQPQMLKRVEMLTYDENLQKLVQAGVFDRHLESDPYRVLIDSFAKSLVGGEAVAMDFINAWREAFTIATGDPIRIEIILNGGMYNDFLDATRALAGDEEVVAGVKELVDVMVDEYNKRPER